MTGAALDDAPFLSPDDWAGHPSWERLQAFGPVGPETCSRLVVVAAHPDDAGLGAGGLIALAHDRGVPVYVVLLTAGPEPRPEPAESRHHVASRRLAEVERALEILAPGAPMVYLGAQDGHVPQVEEKVTSSLVDLLADGRSTLLVAPWRHDGHPDHEAAGRAAAAAARRTGARLAEYPVDMWQHTPPEDAPWAHLRALDLDAEVARRKDEATAAHVRPCPGHREVFVTGSDRTDDALERLHVDVADPWGVEERWYELRKRELSLAMLPRRTYRRALELGCSRGALAGDLAGRCRELVAVDRSPTAVACARARLADLPHVRVDEVDIPDAWPDGEFDLVVLSETGYFLSPEALDRLVERVAATLPPDGVVLLCHWRHPIEGWVLDGPSVHDRFRDDRLPPEQARYADRDVEITVLCAPGHWPDPAS